MPSSIQLLHNRFVRAVLLSQLLSQLGIWIRNFAILLYVVDRTHGDPFAVSMISVAEYGPIFAFSFIGGAFADRWRPRSTAVWCESLSAASVFIVLAVLESGSWEAVFFATFLSSVLSQFAGPSGMKLFKIHVREEDAPGGMSLLQTLVAFFTIAGPMLGTFAYGQLGISNSIFLTGLCFSLSAAALLLIPKDAGPSAEKPDRNALFREIRAGFRYVMVRKELLRLNISFGFVGLGVGLIMPLGVFLVTERLGLSTQHLQWITVPYGAGEIVGGIITFMLATKISPMRLLTIGLAVDGIGILLLGIGPTLWLAMLSQFIIALLQPAIFVGNNALTMQHSEKEYIGRVTGVRTPLMTGAMLLAMSAAGTLQNALSLTVVYELSGLCFLIGLLVMTPLFGRFGRHRKRTDPFTG